MLAITFRQVEIGEETDDERALGSWCGDSFDVRRPLEGCAKAPSNNPDSAGPKDPGTIMLEPVARGSADVSLPSGWADALMGAGLTQCVTPFGIIIGAGTSVPDSYVQMTARWG
jgi:hypothetical protein